MVAGLTMALMCLITLYGIQVVVDSARQTKVGEVLASRTLTNAGCAAVAAMVVAFDAACLYFLTVVL